ncbi:response regulator [bacterium]|nr:response regulator [bacterium]
MKADITILIAEDDEGHASLIQKNLKRSGISNNMKHFLDGQETMDYLEEVKGDIDPNKRIGYLLLLDIRMPKVDGVEVLRRVKEDSKLRRIPVIMITTTDDPREVQRCHELGCSNYITKPIDYDKFVKAIRQLGLFLAVVEVPEMNGF